MQKQSGDQSADRRTQKSVKETLPAHFLCAQKRSVWELTQVRVYNCQHREPLCCTVIKIRLLLTRQVLGIVSHEKASREDQIVQTTRKQNRMRKNLPLLHYFLSLLLFFYLTALSCPCVSHQCLQQPRGESKLPFLQLFLCCDAQKLFTQKQKNIPLVASSTFQSLTTLKDVIPEPVDPNSISHRPTRHIKGVCTSRGECLGQGKKKVFETSFCYIFKKKLSN